MGSHNCWDLLLSPTVWNLISGFHCTEISLESIPIMLLGGWRSSLFLDGESGRIFVLFGGSPASLVTRPHHSWARAGLGLLYEAPAFPFGFVQCPDKIHRVYSCSNDVAFPYSFPLLKALPQ